MIASAWHAAAATSLRLLLLLLILHYVDDFVRDAQVFDLSPSQRSGLRLNNRAVDVAYVVPAHVAFRQAEEFVAVGTGLHHFFEGEVHVGVAVDQVAVEGLAVLELDQHWVPLGGIEKT